MECFVAGFLADAEGDGEGAIGGEVEGFEIVGWGVAVF